MFLITGTDATVSSLATQVTVSSLTVLAIQKAKNSNSPWLKWIHNSSDTINSTISAALAALAAIGIHITWNHGALPGSYMVNITGLTLMGILTGCWDWTKAMVFNELIYRSTVKSVIPPPNGHVEIVGGSGK
jgi:hypothetical protein